MLFPPPPHNVDVNVFIFIQFGIHLFGTVDLEVVKIRCAERFSSQRHEAIIRRGRLNRNVQDWLSSKWSGNLVALSMKNIPRNSYGSWGFRPRGWKQSSQKESPCCCCGSHRFKQTEPHPTPETVAWMAARPWRWKGPLSYSGQDKRAVGHVKCENECLDVLLVGRLEL